MKKISEKTQLTICHVMGGIGIGGISKVVTDILRLNDSMGIQCDLCSTSTKRDHFIPESIRKYFFTCEFSSWKDYSPWHLYSLYRKLRQYDVVHIHHFCLPAMLLSPILRNRICYTVHGNFGYGRQKHMNDVIKQGLLTLFFRFRADAVVYNSHFTRRESQKLNGVPRGEDIVIYNGAEIGRTTGTINPEIQRQLNGCFVIGSFSRFVVMKRIDRLIESFALFAQKHSDSKLLLIGRGPLKAQYEKLVHDNDLDDRVIFSDYKDHIGDYHRACHLCVFPSCNEPFGLAYIETLLQGKQTLIFSDAGGMAEFARKEDICNSVFDMAERMEVLYQHYKRNEDVSNAEERKAFARQYSVEKMNQNYWKLYRKLLKMA